MNAFKTFRSLPPENLKNLLTLFITGFFFWASITTLLPTLPTYIDDLGGTKRDVGLIMGSFAIGLICSRTWLGNWADRRSRKLVILIGTVVAASAPLGYLLVPHLNLLPLVRAYHGIAIAAFTTGYSTLVVDISPREQRGEIIGYMSLIAPIGMGIGPALGSFIQESSGYEVLFITSTIFGIVSFFLANLVREATVQERQQQQEDYKSLPQRSFWALFINPAFLYPTLIFLLIGLLFGALITFLPLFTRENGLNFSPGFFYSYAALSSFLGRVLAGGASDKYGRGIFITGSICFYGLSMMLLSHATSSAELIIAAIFEGTGGGILFPMLIALISDRSYPNERGRVYAICIGGFDLGGAIAGPILGIIDISYKQMFLVSGYLAIVSLVLFFTLSNKSPLRSLRFAFGLEKDHYAL
ncbi:MAG: Staphylopine export protein [Chroococcopsis gigantea SAG 12.99]|jgi:MFS family permease|nr:MFS transporter [Chlorogloea purpurea SAG 13.99]MDV3000485.1 Staphylopine export protein [Chroococcopsis gigantea SAG 12.99]